jgi:hypothetical protein
VLEAEAILERIDRIMPSSRRSGQRWRRPRDIRKPAVAGLDADLAPDSLLDTTAAAARFHRPVDTIRRQRHPAAAGILLGGMRLWCGGDAG